MTGAQQSKLRIADRRALSKDAMSRPGSQNDWVRQSPGESLTSTEIKGGKTEGKRLAAALTHSEGLAAGFQFARVVYNASLSMRPVN